MPVHVVWMFYRMSLIVGIDENRARLQAVTFPDELSLFSRGSEAGRRHGTFLYTESGLAEHFQISCLYLVCSLLGAPVQGRAGASF